MSVSPLLLVGVAALCGLAATALRLPPLVGFLAAGFVLHLCGVPAHVELLHEASELGVVVLLFSLGLHLNPRLLIQSRTVLSTVAAVLIVVGGVGSALALLSAAEGIPTSLGGGSAGLSAWALVGFAASFSSTVLVVALLEDAGRSRSVPGTTAIGVLVLQDVLAVAFLVLAGGVHPAWWAPALLLMPMARPLVARLPLRVLATHRVELLALTGIACALGAFVLGSAAGVGGELAALLMGLMLSGHPVAHRMSEALFTVKELLLVGFFVEIGLGGIPSLGGFALAGLLLLLLPLKVAAYTAVFHLVHHSPRTTGLTTLTLTNYSEFGLIIAAVAAGAGILPAEWVPVLGIAVAGSFVLSTLLQVRLEWFVDRTVRFLPEVPKEKLQPLERPVEIEGVDALVLGMGRVGVGVYRKLADEYEWSVAAIEFIPERVDDLTHRGMTVILGDATDPDLWHRIRLGTMRPRVVILAMPDHDANVTVLEKIRREKLDITVVAVAHHRHGTLELLELGADAVSYLYEGAGSGLADLALEAVSSTSPQNPGREPQE